MLAMNLRFFTIVLAKLPIFALSMIIAKSSSLRAAVLSFFLAAAFSFLPISSFAEFRSDTSFVAVSNASTGLDFAAGSVLDGALSALSVDLGMSAGATLTTFDLIQSLVSGTPVGILPEYTYNVPLSDVLSQETIKIRKDYVVIDGVVYSDVWLPHDAADKFRVNAFDFITHFNILSHSSGTYASGVGSFLSIPVYSVTLSTGETQLSTPSFGPLSVSYAQYSFGDSSIASGVNPGPYRWIDTTINGNTTISGNISWQALARSPIYIRYFSRNGSSWSAAAGTSSDVNDIGVTYNAGLTSSSFESNSFDFTWVSGTIPAEPLPVEQGLRLRVPSSYVSHLPSVVSPELADYVTLIQDLSNSLEQARLADAVESTAFEEYDAPVPPVPSTGTIAEEPYSSLDGTLSGIQDTLDNVDTNIGTVDESLDDIKVYSQDASESLQSIDTNLSQSVAESISIKGFIQQYLPGVHSLLNSISSSVSNIAGSVAAADQTFFGNVVDSIAVPFTPIFNVFKSGMGIWRYVVAWVGNISAPFAWSLSALSGAGSIFLSPIYAAAAAAVVLAVYKKFGR